jgi:hypothetical protein
MYLIRVSHHIYVGHIATDQRSAFPNNIKGQPDHGHRAGTHRWPFYLTVLLTVAISMLLWGLIVFIGNLIL